MSPRTTCVLHGGGVMIPSVDSREPALEPRYTDGLALAVPAHRWHGCLAWERRMVGGCGDPMVQRSSGPMNPVLTFHRSVTCPPHRHHETAHHMRLLISRVNTMSAFSTFQAATISRKTPLKSHLPTSRTTHAYVKESEGKIRRTDESSWSL